MLMVLWTVDTDDCSCRAATIVHRGVGGAKPGAIMLMHDAGGNRSETIAALPRIIRGLRARGYKLVTVPQLLVDNPAPQQAVLRAARRRRLALGAPGRAAGRRPRERSAGHVGDAIPAGLGRELDRLAAAVGLDVDEPLGVLVERDVELALLDALVEPGAAEDQPAQPVHERAF